MYIVVTQCNERCFVLFINFFFSQLRLLIRSNHTLHWRSHLQFREMGGAARERPSRFRPPKSRKEEVSLLECSKPKSIQ